MDDDDETAEFPSVEKGAGGGGAGHFLPYRPMDLALASSMQYSLSLKSNERSNCGFSGRLPGRGGANMWAYRDSAVVASDAFVTRDDATDAR